MALYRPVAVQLAGKHPREVLDYALDFVNQLPDGDALATVDSFDLAAGLTLTPSGKPTPAISGTTVVFWLGGGTAGSSYEGEVKVTTSDGRQLVGCFAIEITDPASTVPT